MVLCHRYHKIPKVMTHERFIHSSRIVSDANWNDQVASFLLAGLKRREIIPLVSSLFFDMEWPGNRWSMIY